MTTTVVTIASGRHDHLARQVEALEGTDHVIVAMNDPAIAGLYPRHPVIELDASGDLPLAAARNAGARAALDRGADFLVFLDVDCLPLPGTIARYESGPAALLAGAVGYLPEGSLDPADASFHTFRPRPRPGSTQLADPLLFWSLSFACSAALWERIGGFDEAYRGYGGEDTDFALRADAAGVDVVFVGGAEAVHQHHESQSPPVNHLDDILRNGALFADRWGFWPMRGWLDDFQRLGLIELTTEGIYARTVTA